MRLTAFLIGSVLFSAVVGAKEPSSETPLDALQEIREQVRIPAAERDRRSVSRPRLRGRARALVDKATQYALSRITEMRSPTIPTRVEIAGYGTHYVY